MYVIGTASFDECFLFYDITGRYYLLWKFTLRLSKCQVAAFFQTSVLKEVRILSLQQQNNANTKVPK